MRLVLAATLALLAGPVYGEYDCVSAQVEMVKAAKVMSMTAEQTGAIDPKTFRTYEEASNKYFACQQSNQWSLAFAPGKPKPAVVATQGQPPPH